MVAAAELVSTSEVAIAVLAAVLSPAVADSLKVEVALSTPLLTSAMLRSRGAEARCGSEAQPHGTDERSIRVLALGRWGAYEHGVCAHLVFLMLSTEEVMLDATLVPTLSIEAEAESRALCNAPETTSMPMPMPIPEARRRASMATGAGEVGSDRLDKQHDKTCGGSTRVTFR